MMFLVSLYIRFYYAFPPHILAFINQPDRKKIHLLYKWLTLVVSVNKRALGQTLLLI